MKNLFLLAILLSAPLARAGDKAGNGGNVVLCTDPAGKVTSVQLLDYYEAQTIWRFQLDLGDPLMDPQAKVQRVLERVRRLHPFTAEALEARSAGFFDDALLLSNVELAPVDDSGEYFLPVGCKLKQIAVQRQKQFPEDKTFLINKDVWDILDNDQRAGLILHEIAYEKLLHTKPPYPFPGQPQLEPESRQARYFNALASSAGYAQITPDQMVPLLRDLWFLTDFTYEGVTLTQVVAYPQGGFSGQLPKDGPVTLEFGGRPVQMEPGSTVNWHYGKVTIAVLANKTTFTAAGQTFAAAAGRTVQLDTDGSLLELTLAADSVYDWNGRSIPIRGGARLSLNPDGSPRLLSPLNEEKWSYALGEVWSGFKGNAMFHADGSLSNLNCLSHAHDLRLTDTQDRVLLCHQGKCKWNTGDEVTWPDTISLNPAGKVTQLSSLDPKNTDCR